jgi:hypothetical protein
MSNSVTTAGVEGNCMIVPDNPYALEKQLTVFICHGFKLGTLSEVWPKLKKWR